MKPYRDPCRMRTRLCILCATVLCFIMNSVVHTSVDVRSNSITKMVCTSKGVMGLKGNIYESQGTLTPGVGDIAVKASSVVVAYFDSSAGDWYLQGTLVSTEPDPGDVIFSMDDADSDTVFVIDDDGNMWLEDSAVETAPNPWHTDRAVEPDWYVAPWGTDASGHGASEDDPFETIGYAIDAASAGDEIQIMAGTYEIDETIDIDKDVVLLGQYKHDPWDSGDDDNPETIIDGGYGGYSIFTVDPNATVTANCQIIGLTLYRGGNIVGILSDGPGGGINANDQPITVEYCKLRDCSVLGFGEDTELWAGGAIDGSAGLIRNNELYDNDGDIWGGALAHCTGTIEYNKIYDNHAACGGGLSKCSGVIRKNEINDNTANFGGGLGGCDGFIERNDIHHNTAEYTEGGGLYGCGGMIQNNLIYANTAMWGGGGLSYCGNAGYWPCQIRNNTIYGNISNFDFTDDSDPEGVIGEGGGVYDCYGDVMNNIIWANQRRTGASSYVSDQFVASSDPNAVYPIACCIQGYTGDGTDNITGDPDFVSTTEGDEDFLKLSWVSEADHSPCINKGAPYPLTETKTLNGHTVYHAGEDYFGNLRIDEYGRADIGAHEYPGTVASKPALKIFILSGQSNMEGFNSKANWPSGQFTDYVDTNEDVLYCFLGAWIDFSASPVQFHVEDPELGPLPSGWHRHQQRVLNDFGVGPEVAFGQDVADELDTGEKALIVKLAIGGGTLGEDWTSEDMMSARTVSSLDSFLPNEAAGRSQLVDDALGDVLIKQVHSLKEYFTDMGYTVEVAGFVWHQGESDGVFVGSEQDQTASDYGENLEKMVDALRTEFGSQVKAVWVQTQRLQYHEEATDIWNLYLPEMAFHPDLVRAQQLRLAEYRMFDYITASKAVKRYDNSKVPLSGGPSVGFIGDDHPTDSKPYTINVADLTDMNVMLGIGGEQIMDETMLVYMDDLPTKDDEIHYNFEGVIKCGQRFAKAMDWMLTHTPSNEPDGSTANIFNFSEIYYHYGRFKGTVGYEDWAHYQINFSNDVLSPDEWYIEVETLNSTTPPSFYVFDESYNYPHTGQNGLCTVDFSSIPRNLTWYISLYGGSGGSDYSLKTYRVYHTSAGTLYDQNVKWGQWKYYKITVPSGKTQMTVKADLVNNLYPSHYMDADLFLRLNEPARENRVAAGQKADNQAYDTDETLTISVSGGQTWYIGVKGRGEGHPVDIDTVYVPGEKELSGNDFDLRVTFQ